MSLVEVPDVPEATVRSLRVKAASRGQSLAAYLREEFERLSTSPSNDELVRRLLQMDRTNGPTTEESVAEIRRTHEGS